MSDGTDLKGRILVVDDQVALLEVLAELLREAGHTVFTAENGSRAASLLAKESFDAALSDIDMPDINGIELLRLIRQRDLDLPVLLMTGNPVVDTAIRAVEYGALLYLIKPIREHELLEAIQKALRLHQLARLKRQAMALSGQVARQVGDLAGLEARFKLALQSMWIAHQPIVDLGGRRVVAYEALLRSDEPALPSPIAVITAAEQLGRMTEVGRAVRKRVARALAGSDRQAFVNLHSLDLLDEALYDPDAPLSRHASRVVLEITERAALHDVGEASSRIEQLRRLGYRVAVDDLGAGYAGLSTFAVLNPDFVKLDMSLVRGVDRQPAKRQIISALIGLCRDLRIGLIAEGVETPEERDALASAGCELLQGYLFGRPSREPAEVQW